MIPTDIAVIMSEAGNEGIRYIAGMAIMPPATPTITGIYLSGIFLTALHSSPRR
jgi:hypothetical protein